MLDLWLLTIAGCAIFFTVFYFFFQTIRSALNPEDSRIIDKQPEDDPNE